MRQPGAGGAGCACGHEAAGSGAPPFGFGPEKRKKIRLLTASHRRRPASILGVPGWNAQSLRRDFARPAVHAEQELHRVNFAIVDGDQFRPGGRAHGQIGAEQMQVGSGAAGNAE